MVFHLLPKRVFGQDIDELLAYSTPKVAWVRDRYIGGIYYICLTVITVWVVFVSLLWRNEHFELKDVRGLPRIWVQHPTKNLCDVHSHHCMSDFKPIAELPYCSKFTGSAMLPHRAKCVYADKHTLFPDGSEIDKVFLPTTSALIVEHEHCDPESADGCESVYKMEDSVGDIYDESRMNFYADIESYVIQLTSSYDREDIGGTSLDHHGYYSECENKRGSEDKYWDERTKGFDCGKTHKRSIVCLPGSNCVRAVESTQEKQLRENMEDMQQAGKSTEKMGTDVTEGTREATEHSMNFVQAGAATGGGLRGNRIAGHHADHAHGSMHRDAFVLDRPPEETAGRGSWVYHGGHGYAHGEGYGDGGRTGGAQVPEGYEVPDIFGTSWGDGFRLGKLLELAGADLDRDYNTENFTTRQAGTIIEIEVVYSNLEKLLSSFGLSRVRYQYNVHEKRLPYVSREFLDHTQPADFPRTRRRYVQHGILLVFTVGGQFGFFNIVHVLIVLTTFLTLMGGAHKIIDIFSIYVHPRRENYFHLKYDVSPDFSDMWRCTKCGFYNSQNDQECRGIPSWSCAADDKTTVCKERRPTSGSSSTPPSPSEQRPGAESQLFSSARPRG